MTHPLRMSDRARLMLGCGSAALALALACAPEGAAAQGIQASPAVVNGSANVVTVDPTTTRVDVESPTAVINWRPILDQNGNVLNFLRTGATAIFQGAQGGNFAVLNRILPDNSNAIAVIDGRVIGRVGSAATGFQPGGFIAFYSPTGILVGQNASFDVGRLMLTTLDMTAPSFDSFVNGGFLTLSGQQGSTATITVSPGAQITATQENSFFAIVAADIEMRGTALVNGSHAYVAGEVVSLRYSNGLFDIFVPTGTAATGEVVTLDGTIGGPSSTGAGDNHMIYAVTRGDRDPISMLLRGTIGFEPAQTAGIVNGEIVLAANYSVFGRNVGSGAIGQDITTVQFRRSDAASNVRADITLQDFNARSSLLAIGTGRTLATSLGANSSVAGNLMLVGRESAAIEVPGARSFTVSGDVLVDARDFGVVGSGLQSLDVINARGGTARIAAGNPDALVAVGGRTLVTAEAVGGAEITSRTAGSATGGTAEIVVTGGRFTSGGAAAVRASALGTTFRDVRTGAQSRGGTARLLTFAGGRATLDADLTILAEATAARGDPNNPSTVSSAFGGTAQLALEGAGAVGIRGNVLVGARAVADAANAATGGALADAGEASVTLDGANTLAITGGLTLVADATGGQNNGGRGGTALGGAARATARAGGRLTVTGLFSASANGTGGDGVGGGDAFGGIAGANALTGTIELGGDALVNATGRGGNAAFGFGGIGGTGRGGNALLQANGGAGQPARLTVGGNAALRAEGFGGTGGNSDGQAIAAGRGGDGFGGAQTLPNQADPQFLGGAYLLAGSDFGEIVVTGEATVSAQGTGGSGGAGLAQLAPGTGGNGIGGFARAGLALLGGTGAVGGGVARFGDLVAISSGLGGAGGLDPATNQTRGAAGAGRGGTALLTIDAGTVTGRDLRLTAVGLGGIGGVGGSGTGGNTTVTGSLRGRLDAARLALAANGDGGLGTAGRGGDGIGGTAGIVLNGIAANIAGNLDIEASGRGSNAVGASGDGRGGEAYIATTTPAGQGSLVVGGHAGLLAVGQGGDSFLGFAAGNGQGGLAFIDVLGGSSVTLGSAQLGAVGRGGEATVHKGGNGTGGTARLLAGGAASRLVVQRNVTNAIAIESPAGGAFLSADGIGLNSFGGDGIGGQGRGGSVSLVARGGGSIALPGQPLTDPDTVGALLVAARGTGGRSAVQGGAGGSGAGGTAEITVDGQGSRVSMGAANFTAAAQGGSSLDASRNITGGAALGGRQSIQVLNGGSLGLAAFDGQTGARGGDGSGTGNGGEAASGRHLLTLDGGSLAVTGVLALVDRTIGGNGSQAGNAAVSTAGGVVEFGATNANITVTPDAQGAAGITLASLATGGNGGSGGNAVAGPVSLTLDATTLAGGALRLRSQATGGSAAAPGGTGGSALAGGVALTLRNAALVGMGDVLAFSEGLGGAGGSLGAGGAGTGGNVDAALTDSSLALAAGGVVTLRSNGTGGTSGTGTATAAGTAGRAALTLTRATLDAAQVQVLAQSQAIGRIGGGPGGTATGGDAQVRLAGNARLDAGTVTINAGATSSSGGTARGGTASLALATGGTARLTATALDVRADALGGTAGSNVAGRFSVGVGGGSAALGSLAASALGDTLDAAQPASQLTASGGNLRITGATTADALGDITLTTGQGGVIGDAAAAGNTATLAVTSAGTIRTLGDGSAGSGIAGQAITLLAGRSILLGGGITGRGGTITLTANRGGGPALAQPQPAAITMAQGSRIDAGAGTVTMRLLDGAGDPQRTNGAITLASIAAGRIDVRNLGTSASSDIGVRADGGLTASGSGRAIDLASLNGEVINPAGDAGLVLTGGGHYGIFAATPTGSQIGSFANYARRYNVPNAAAYDALNPGGNFAAFRIAPVLTVTADNASRFYGSANPAFTASFTGFLPGDGVANLSGSPQFTTLATATSGIGQFALNIALGTLLSEQGYQFTFAPGVLTVTPRPITVTADSLSRFYGNANPALTYTVGGLGLVNGDQLTGALATSAGATTGVGTAAITQGTLAASANYALSFVNGQLTIVPRPLTITANALSRIYGNANPALTFTLGGLGLVNGDQLSGALATSATTASNVGAFAITQGTLTAGANYAITYNAANLTITPRPITVTADSLSRIYGNANPALTYTVGGLGLVNGDQLTGALATLAGPTSGVGSFAITQGTLAASANYALSFVNGQLTVTPRPITVTADNLTRFYGNANPALTFTVGGLGLVNGDQLSGLLATAAGLTTGVGSFAITQGTLAASANYAVSFAPGVLTVTPRPITVTADSLSRFYGNANPALTYTVGGLGLVNGDQLSGALATSATTASNVGAFAITQGTLTAGANYAITYNAANLTITPRPITVTADSLSRIYGNANPALTFTVGGLGLVNGDQLTGALATLAGPTTGVGSFAITQGTLAASANYAVSFAPGVLTVTPRPITVTADSLSRFYGNANPALTYTVGGLGLVNGDQLTGALATSAGATTGVGTAAITQGTLAASGNYALTFVNGQLTITPRPLTITANALSRIYGNANPALTFTLGGLGLVNGDQLSGALATSATAASNVGAFAITQGTLTAGANYAITYNAANLTITPRPITITADSLSRIYGNANPALTYTVGGLGLVNGDQLTGALATLAGPTSGVGSFAITQGTLAASANYALSFVNGQLTITPRPITIVADSLRKFLGATDPALTFTVGGLGLVNGDQLSGGLLRDPGERLGTFAIRQGTLGAGVNYTITYVGGELAIDAPPRPPGLSNPTAFEPPLAMGDQKPRTRNEDEDRYGIDFPDGPETPLISEDPLLDDPVTSGGDAAVYGTGAPAAPGGN